MMTSEDIGIHEGEFTRSGIHRYDILKKYKIGGAVQLDDFCEMSLQIEELDKKLDDSQ